MKEKKDAPEKEKKKKKKGLIIFIIILILLIVIGAVVVVLLLMNKGDDGGGGGNGGNVDVDIDPGGNSGGGGGGGGDPGVTEGEGKLAISLSRDLSDQTEHIQVPVDANYTDATYMPNPALMYGGPNYLYNLPDDIAKQEGAHSIYNKDGKYTFFSFSFWLANVGTASLDVDMRMTFTVTRGENNATKSHIEDAMRFMIVLGEPLLSDNTYTIYKKAEKDGEDYLYAKQDGVKGVMYSRDRVQNFESDTCVFERSGDNAIKNLAAGASMKVTVVMWVEGCDKDCRPEIAEETLSAKLEFAAN